MTPDEEVFYPLQPLFAKYSSDQFEFIVGKAEQLDPDTNTLAVSSKDQMLSIKYDTLVVATGTAAQENMPFKTLSSTDETRDAIHSLRSCIQAAKLIIIAGAGPTGVEVAGELGHAYSLHGRKEIILISSKELPLCEEIRKDIREIARNELEKLKVTIVPNSHVSFVTEVDGTQSVKVISGSQTWSFLTNVFIPTYGTVPNTSFMPKTMLDGKGFVKQNLFLQADGYNNIFAIGDVGNLQPTQGKYVEDQLVYPVKNLDAQITGVRGIAEYKIDNRLFLGVSIGPTAGTGQFGNWKIWGFLISQSYEIEDSGDRICQTDGSGGEDQIAEELVIVESFRKNSVLVKSEHTETSIWTSRKFNDSVKDPR